MRRLTFVLFGLLGFCLVSCGPDKTLPKRSLHYSPPAVHPVREKVTLAQKHAEAEKTAADNAIAALDKAKSVAPADVPDLQEALAEASGQVNTIRTENEALRAALDDTQGKIDELEKKVSDQTQSLNVCVDDKNSAIAAVDSITKEKAIVEKRYLRLKRLFCGIGAAIAAYLAHRFGIFGLLRKLWFLGPWGIAGAIAAGAAIPGIVFAVLWRVF